MKLLAFPTVPSFSLPKALRDLADRYEAGDYDTPLSFVYVTESDDGISWGLVGEADYIRASALFNLAADHARTEALAE